MASLTYTIDTRSLYYANNTTLSSDFGPSTVIKLLLIFSDPLIDPSTINPEQSYAYSG
jgi:hypothetical protein